MAALKLYYFEPNMLQTLDDSEVENRLEIAFADLVKDAKLVAGFFPCRQFLVEPNGFTY